MSIVDSYQKIVTSRRFRSSALFDRVGIFIDPHRTPNQWSASVSASNGMDSADHERRPPGPNSSADNEKWKPEQPEAYFFILNRIKMVRGPKKHLKRLNAPKHWMLDKLGGIFVRGDMKDCGCQRGYGRMRGSLIDRRYTQTISKNM